MDAQDFINRRRMAGVTREVAEHFAGLARGLRERGFEPQLVARFLDRIVFCLFAEDLGLLPEGFAPNAAPLFGAMRRFDGGLCAEGPVLPLDAGEIEALKAVARLDWGAVDASVFGTLFERGLDPDTRAQL